jgi:hypothetical protein
MLELFCCSFSFLINIIFNEFKFGQFIISEHIKKVGIFDIYIVNSLNLLKILCV